MQVLIFGELGTDTLTYNLAYDRFAHRQATFWCAISSCIPTVDYYVSSKLFEQHRKLRSRQPCRNNRNGKDNNAGLVFEDHFGSTNTTVADMIGYSERVVLMNSLAMQYTPPPKPNSPFQTNKLFRQYLDKRKYNIYGALQLHFKISPGETEDRIIGILLRDPDALIVFSQYTDKQIHDFAKWRDAHLQQNVFRRLANRYNNIVTKQNTFLVKTKAEWKNYLTNNNGTHVKLFDERIYIMEYLPRCVSNMIFIFIERVSYGFRDCVLKSFTF